MADKRCECGDSQCPNHPGQAQCLKGVKHRLRRVDMDDYTGIRMCPSCAQDAYDSGLFVPFWEQGVL